jgi:hypothetical protein
VESVTGGRVLHVPAKGGARVKCLACSVGEDAGAKRLEEGEKSLVFVALKGGDKRNQGRTWGDRAKVVARWGNRVRPRRCVMVWASRSSDEKRRDVRAEETQNTVIGETKRFGSGLGAD